MLIPPRVDPHAANFHFRGGTGGSGGPGHGQGTGGSGGQGEGPRLNWNITAGTMNNILDSSTSIATDRDTVIEWYSPLNLFLRQDDIFSTHQAGTGGWFLENQTFMEWKSGMGKVLWCQGMPGAGKTVICSLVVHHLRAHADDNVGVAAIYLNHKESDVHSPPNLLAGLWRQLVVGKSTFNVEELWKVHREPGTRPSLKDDLNVLRSIISEYSKVFIVVDALDEYLDPDRDILLEQLSLLSPDINLMLTSRPHIIVEHRIPDFTTLEIRATPEDIRTYMGGKILGSPRMAKHLRNSPDLQDVIEAKVVHGNDGMFLLAKLHIDSLMEKLTIKSVREALASIPGDLKHAYDEVVQRIDRQSEHDRRLAWRALCWITHAKRPLGRSELLEALAVEPGDKVLDPENLMDEDIVVSVCSGLVVINRKDDTVRLIHYTMQNYLEQFLSREFPDAPLQITTTCLTYLSFPTISRLSRPHPHNLPSEFFMYVAEYWMEHARGEPESQLKPLILSFLTSPTEWLQPRIPWLSQGFPTNAVWIAAAFKLDGIYHHFLDFFSRNELSLVLQRLRVALRDAKPLSAELLELSETDAQVLVELLQTWLDRDGFQVVRPSLFQTLLRFCGADRLYPTCFALTSVDIAHPVTAGVSADLWKGVVCGQVVSVKVMRVFLGEDFSPVYEQFGHAALIWRQLCHPNILPFLGLCHWTARSFSLVSPWMENGNILRYVNKEFPRTDARISLFLDVALGVEYLHQNGVAHGYLKPSKILITASRRACIIDFGFSSIHNAGIGSADPSPPAGAVRYQAPELFTSENPSPSLFESDVYAFGCVCYEVLTGNVPFFEVRNDMAVIIAVAGGRRPSQTQSCTGTPALDNLWSLIQDCWKHNPDERPTAGQIVERLVAPPIQATTQSTMDWDEKSTARFRRSLQAQTLQPPAITEIERQLL